MEFPLWHSKLRIQLQQPVGGADSIPGPEQWVKGSNIAAAAAQILSLALELPHAVGVAIKKKRKKKVNSRY